MVLVLNVTATWASFMNARVIPWRCFLVPKASLRNLQANVLTLGWIVLSSHKNVQNSADSHSISGCNFVRSLWSRIGWVPEEITKTTELWQTRTPRRVHECIKSVAHPLILLYCWEIWKHRNKVIFRARKKKVIFRRMEPSVDRLIAACNEAGCSWSCRLPKWNTTMAERWSTTVWYVINAHEL